MKHSQIGVGDIELHVVETGEGRPVLFCHGFPDLWIGWRRQMEAVAKAGYRAIALDMRGFGKSSAPAERTAYTPFHTVGDLVRLLDVMGLETVTIVGHDFGANIAWNAALIRPDRFTAVFGVSVPFMPRGDQSYLEAITDAGMADRFYMFDEMTADAAGRWKDASVTFPGFLYWSSGSPDPAEQWDPFDADRLRMREAPVSVPPWADPEDIAYCISEFERTGFQGGLNYYSSIQPGFDLSAPYRGALIHQPSYYVVGEADGLTKVRALTEEDARKVLPGLRGFLSLPKVGHWPQQEAPGQFNAALLSFLDGLDM